jgi:hypothetical protein
MLFLWMFLPLLLSAETINEQIHALQNATPQERVELMNSIKEQLISMNENKRMATLASLREKLQQKDKSDLSVEHDESNILQEHLSHDEHLEHIETTTHLNETIHEEVHEEIDHNEENR